MKKSRPDLLHGTLDLLIMQSLADGPMHGWAISKHIREISKDVLEVNQGSLYPALHRLEQEGRIASKWRASENNRRAKYYRLTRTGKKKLFAETENWERVSSAIARVLEAT